MGTSCPASVEAGVGNASFYCLHSQSFTCMCTGMAKPKVAVTLLVFLKVHRRRNVKCDIKLGEDFKMVSRILSRLFFIVYQKTKGLFGDRQKAPGHRQENDSVSQKN